MPTYDYVCEACGHELELFQSISAAPRRKCPACKKSRLRRKIGGGAGFLFKGSGFYLTDYRSDSYKKGAAAEGGSTPGADAKKPAESTSGETKSGASGSPPEAAKKPAAPASGEKKKKTR